MNVLAAPPGNHLWLQLGATLLLLLHISGGTLGLVSGAGALMLKKGSRQHAAAGRVFFLSMLVMASIGAGVSPFLFSPGGDRNWFDALAGAFTCYLVATGWVTVRRRPQTTGAFEVAALGFACLGVIGSLTLAWSAVRSPTGMIGEYGPEGFGAFAGMFGLSAALDLRFLLRGGLTGSPRIARHLWRMCTALFIAAGSFFFGQQQVMPEAVRGSPFQPYLRSQALRLCCSGWSESGSAR